MVDNKDTSATAGQKRAWASPELSFDGELREYVRGSKKPTAVLGEPGDPGSKAPGQPG